MNKKEYDWDDQFGTGRQLRELGEVKPEEDIFLEGDSSDEYETIDDDTKIDLARPGIEHFISKEIIVEITIIVNGTPKKWRKKKITFVEVIIEAFGKYIDKPTMVYTVAYEDGPKQNPEGSMVKGSSVFVKNKMIFHATATDKS
ncbi:MAG: multiubiquitin domain-containing protein [Chitinophagaceae bacterium]|nr:multiubiquitin domain-containing protein [Chitinophagaceae bacterium]